MATVTVAKRDRAGGKKSYVIQYIDPKTDEKKYYCTVRKMADAHAIENELRSRIDRGLPVISFKKRNTGNLFSEHAEKLKENWLQKVQAGELSPVTRDGYLYFLAALVQKWGGRPIPSITMEEVLEYRSLVAGEWSASLSNRRLFVLKQVFKLAVDQGVQGCADVGSIKQLSENERNRFLMPQELDRLIEAARPTRAKYYLPLAIMLGAEHGTSLQEVTSLNWSDIHFLKHNEAFVNFQRTKNDSERTHIIMPRTFAELMKWKSHLENRRSKRHIPVLDNYLICHLNGTGMKDFDTSWENACKKAGIEDLTYHDLRHCYCSNILFAGGTLKDAKEMIGHKTLKMTDRYAHLESIRQQSVQLKLAAHYAGKE